MKTPLAALAAQSRLIREGGSDPRVAADGLDRAIAAAAAAVEAELARARAAASRHALQDAQAAPLSVAQRLISVLERTDKGMRLDYVLDIPDSLRLAVTGEDLSEMLGPLLENAVRFARRQVRVAGKALEGASCCRLRMTAPASNRAMRPRLWCAVSDSMKPAAVMAWASRSRAKWSRRRVARSRWAYRRSVVCGLTLVG